MGTIPGTNVDGAFPPWNFNCTGVTYTNPQVREAPVFRCNQRDSGDAIVHLGSEKIVKCVSK